MTFNTGQKIGSYRIVRLLGQGGMGAAQSSGITRGGAGVESRAQLQRLGVAMRRFKTYTTTLARKMIGAATL